MSIQKNRGTFDLKPISLTDTLHTTVEWLIHQDVVKDQVAASLRDKLEMDEAWG